MPDSFPEERLCRFHIPSRAETEVHSPSILVQGSIKVSPLAPNLDIGFVDSPGPSGGLAEPIPALDELWSKLTDPSHDRRMSHAKPAFGQHLNQITKTKLVA